MTPRAFATAFAYDEFGRLTGERPADTSWIELEYQLPNHHPAQPRAVAHGQGLRQRPDDLYEGRVVDLGADFDSLGRLTEERLQLPITAGVREKARTFTYYPFGVTQVGLRSVHHILDIIEALGEDTLTERSPPGASE